MTAPDYTYLCKYCHEKGDYPRLILTLPNQVHCSDCGREVGTLSESVTHSRAVRAADTVTDYKTGDTLAEIEWDDERVIERD